jgi:hypothetical protein
MWSLNTAVVIIVSPMILNRIRPRAFPVHSKFLIFLIVLCLRIYKRLSFTYGREISGLKGRTAATAMLYM